MPSSPSSPSRFLNRFLHSIANILPGNSGIGWLANLYTFFQIDPHAIAAVCRRRYILWVDVFWHCVEVRRELVSRTTFAKSEGANVDLNRYAQPGWIYIRISNPGPRCPSVPTMHRLCRECRNSSTLTFLRITPLYVT